MANECQLLTHRLKSIRLNSGIPFCVERPDDLTRTGMNYNRERAAPRSNVMFLRQLGKFEGAIFDSFHGPIMARRTGLPALSRLREAGRGPVGRLAFSDSVAILQSG